MNKSFLVILSLFLVCCSESQKDETGNELQSVADYYETGELRSKVHKLNGRQHGPAVFYYKDGDTLVIQNWENGLKQGGEIRYHPNGKIKDIYSFNSDTLIQVKSFRADGSRKLWQLFGRNGVITHEYFYDSLNNIISKDPLISLKPKNDTLIYGIKNEINVFAVNYDTTSQMDFTLFKVTKNNGSIYRDTIPFDSRKSNFGKIRIKPEKEGELQLTGVITERFAPRRELVEGDTFTEIQHWQSWEIFLKQE